MRSKPLILPILHFNDVYNITRPDEGHNIARILDKDGRLYKNTGHLVRFAKRIQEIRDSWRLYKKQGLLLFSGDVFSASLESLLTRGRCMVLVMNELAPNACVPGNHEFDYNGGRFKQLVEFCNFPWVLSNIEDKKDSNSEILKDLPKYLVREVEIDGQTVRIGIIGLMSNDTISKTDASAVKFFDPSDMNTTCADLADSLRDNHNCDLVFAITHALYKEDIELAEHVNCYTEARFSELNKGKLEDASGVDLILGGHDHDYYLGGGVKLEDTIGPAPAPYAKVEGDNGMLIIKSGTDFEDLSEIAITIEDRGGKRKKVITSVKVIRHHDPGAASQGEDKEISQKSRMSDVLDRILDSEALTQMAKPVAHLPPERAYVLANENEASRKGETVLGNWIADSMIRWYQDFSTSDLKKSDDLIFIMTGGAIRVNPKPNDPSKITQGDIVKLVPFSSRLCTLKLSGQDLHAVLEDALEVVYSTGNTSSGSFPVVSGLQVEWDSKKTTKPRVTSLKLRSGTEEMDVKKEGEEVKYNVLTYTYLSNGGDGLKTFALERNQKQLYESEVTVYQALLKVIEGQSKLSLAPLFTMLESFITERPEEASQLIAAAKMDLLPELNIPLEIDGRVKDVAQK